MSQDDQHRHSRKYFVKPAHRQVTQKCLIYFGTKSRKKKHYQKIIKYVLKYATSNDSYV